MPSKKKASATKSKPKSPQTKATTKVDTTLSQPKAPELKVQTKQAKVVHQEIEQPTKDTSSVDAPNNIRNSPEQLQQVNVTWDMLEDRLILRASTNHDREFRFWITFRMYRMLIGAFDKIEDTGEPAPLNPTSASHLRDIKREETLSKSDFSTSYQPTVKKEVDPVFGDKPLLIEQVNIAVKNNIVALDFIGSGKQARLPIGRDNVVAIRHLMDRCAAQADWCQPTDVKVPTIDKAPDDRLLH